MCVCADSFIWRESSCVPENEMKSRNRFILFLNLMRTLNWIQEWKINLFSFLSLPLDFFLSFMYLLDINRRLEVNYPSFAFFSSFLLSLHAITVSQFNR